jgi:formamidopyrimidine-DNA glycosylase
VPELPEVETVRRHLAPAVEGRVLTGLEVLDARFTAPASPGALDEVARGRRVLRLGRRGKYLVWHLEGDVYVVMHLRMTGNLILVEPVGDGPRPHLRARFRLEGGPHVLFCDPRRFGTGCRPSSRPRGCGRSPPGGAVP